MEILKGVNFDKQKRKWVATFCYQQNKKLVGKFNTYEEAVVARIREEQKVYSQIENIIKRQRLLLHKSRKELAEELGIAPTTLSKYENNKSVPSYNLLEKLSKALNVSEKELLENIKFR